jgi:hypothetical protein
MIHIHRKPASPIRCPLLFVAAFCDLCSGQAFAQGCVSCYTSAAAGGSQTIHALRSGILILLFPPVLIFGGIVRLMWRWSKSSLEPADKA